MTPIEQIISPEQRQALHDAGYAIVPVKPTRAMLDAAGKAMSPAKRPTQKFVSVRAKHAIRYRAMVSAYERQATHKAGTA